MSFRPLTPIKQGTFDALTYRVAGPLYKRMYKQQASVSTQLGEARYQVLVVGNSAARQLRCIEPRRLSGFQRLRRTFELWRQYVAGEIPTTPGSKYQQGYGTFWYRLNGGD